MTDFIHDDFLLKTAAARRLFHEHAAGLPIVDYHHHLDPHALAEDRAFENITQLWIATDPYKRRAMRIAGVPERLITGVATDREKFDACCATGSATKWKLANCQRTWARWSAPSATGTRNTGWPRARDRKIEDRKMQSKMIGFAAAVSKDWKRYMPFFPMVGKSHGSGFQCLEKRGALV